MVVKGLQCDDTLVSQDGAADIVGTAFLTIRSFGVRRNEDDSVQVYLSDYSAHRTGAAYDGGSAELQWLKQDISGNGLDQFQISQADWEATTQSPQERIYSAWETALEASEAFTSFTKIAA
jgi:hypothetical protein